MSLFQNSKMCIIVVFIFLILFLGVFTLSHVETIIHELDLQNNLISFARESTWLTRVHAQLAVVLRNNTWMHENNAIMSFYFVSLFNWGSASKVFILIFNQYLFQYILLFSIWKLDPI